MNKLEEKGTESRYKVSRRKSLVKTVVYEKAEKLCKSGMSQNQVFEKLLCDISADRVSRICDDLRDGNESSSYTGKEAREIFAIVEEVFTREREETEEMESDKRFRKSFFLVAFVSLILFMVSVSFFIQMMF